MLSLIVIVGVSAVYITALELVGRGGHRPEDDSAYYQSQVSHMRSQRNGYFRH